MNKAILNVALVLFSLALGACEGEMTIAFNATKNHVDYSDRIRGTEWQAMGGEWEGELLHFACDDTLLMVHPRYDTLRLRYHISSTSMSLFASEPTDVDRNWSIVLTDHDTRLTLDPVGAKRIRAIYQLLRRNGCG